MDFFPAEGGLGDTTGEFRTAQRIVEQSGIAAMVEEWRTEDQAGRKPGPTLWPSEVQVITLMLVLTLSRRSALFTEMRRLLREASTASLGVILDVAVPGGFSDSALYLRAYNSDRRLVRLMDPQPGSLYRTLMKDQLAQRRAARDMEASRTRRARAHQFGNALLWGTWILLPRKVRREFKGDIAVDATVIEAPAQGRSHASLFASSDPEAGWYKRDGDHKGEVTSRAATKYQRRSPVVLWAKELHIAVTYGEGRPSSSSVRPSTSRARR